MDIVTQGLLGGVLAQTVAGKDEKKLATLTGVVAGILADADALIQSSNDPLLNIEYHRHFTHSLFFIPFGAAIAMIILWPFLCRHLSIRSLYLFCLAGYSMSGVLDACTSYGTHLFWPFSDERIALNIISIIDPIFTLVLLCTLLLGLRIKRKVIGYTGLAFCIVYLGLGFVQLNRAQDLASEITATRGHTVVKHVVKPTLGNLVLWRSVYIHDNRIYVDAVRLGIFSEDQIFEGESVEKFSMHNDLPGLEMTSVLYNDIQRFQRFSNGFVGFDPTQKNVLGDIRYSMLPIHAKPLWGIVIRSDQPHLHADYRFFRDSSRGMRETFVNMVIGKS